MQKIKEFILTKDFIIRSLCSLVVVLFGALLSLVLFIASQNYKLTKEIQSYVINNDKQIELNQKDIVYLFDDVKEIRNKIFR